MMRELRIRISAHPWLGQFRVLAGQRVDGGGWAILTQAIFTTVGEGDVVPDGESIHVERDTLQDVFDQLWGMGFRPADGTGNAGHIVALSDHVADLRKTSSRLLGIVERAVGAEVEDAG